MEPINFIELINTICSRKEVEGIMFTFNDESEKVFIPAEKVFEWELSRAKYTLPALKRLGIGIQDGIETLNSGDFLKSFRLAQVQLIDVPNLKHQFAWQTYFSELVTRFITYMSHAERAVQCFVTLQVPNCCAKKFVEWITVVLGCQTKDDTTINILACPDHYLFTCDLFQKRVIFAEVTGGSPLIALLQLDVDNPTGVNTPADPDFPLQMIGTARLSDGTVIGGIRYQFRDIADPNQPGMQWCEARFCVELPEMTPPFMVREHQWHMALEWARWFQMYLILSKKS